ncbi:MAG: PLP-dependent aspartate aminotransferase family protein [Turneriella sp.]|nr:PLP-dependent aspartate aminotransferase family protein [Turneriella sp.]
MSKKTFQHGLSTRAIHAGYDPASDPHRSVIAPIYQTATYSFAKVEDLWAFYQKQSDRLAEYARYGTPTEQVLAQTLAALEDAEDAIITASGMSAIASAILAVVNAGDHVVSLREGYRGTFKMFDQHLARLGIQIHYVPVDTEAVCAAINAGTKAVFLEFPTNPYLRLVDLEKIAHKARAQGAITIADATFATPLNTNPLKHGADLVVHSLTKFLSGHNDTIAGAVLGPKELIEKARGVRSLLGCNPDPHLCYLVLRGVKTFAVRMREHNRSALAIARWLEKHPKIARVWYPLLESHPDHALAQRYLRGGGGVVSFQVRTDDIAQEAQLAASTRLLEHLKLPAIAASLGGVESLVHQPSVMSYYDMTAEERLREGIPDGLVRYSVGLEDTEDLIADLAQALEKV